jgi:excisionase family DNA binding protein
MENPTYIGDDRFLTIPEAAEIATVSRRRIDVAVLNREVPVVEYGERSRRIKLSDLRKWISSKTTKAVAR